MTTLEMIARLKTRADLKAVAIRLAEYRELELCVQQALSCELPNAEKLRLIQTALDGVGK